MGGRPLAAALVAVAVVVVALAATFGWASYRESRVDACLANPPGSEHLAGARVELRWEWTPPGYACVFRDPRTGRVIAVERR